MSWLRDGLNGLFGKAKLPVKQELHATVIRACSKCRAAGVDEYGKNVGDICPSCGAKRPKTEDLGRIWYKRG